MPVVLAAIGELFAVGFLLISFIGWIINMINSQNPPPAPNRGPQRRPKARDRKVQNEIEQFLQEAMGKKGGRQAEVRDDEIEILEPAPKERRSPKRRPRPVAPASRKQQKPPAPPIPPPRQQPGTELGARHMKPSEDLGRSVSSHVQDHMRERMSDGANQNLPHLVDQSIQQHLGEFTADDHDPRTTVRPLFASHANVPDPTGLIAELRKPGGMRRAIILQEILSKPRGLKR